MWQRSQWSGPKRTLWAGFILCMELRFETIPPTRAGEHPIQTVLQKSPNTNLGSSEKPSHAGDGARPGGITLRIWCRVLLGLCLIQFALLLIVTFGRQSVPATVPTRGKLYSNTNHEPFFVGRPGPWGELEYARINVEPPDDFVPTGSEPFVPTRWTFHSYSRVQLRALFEACELSAAQRKELMDEAGWTDDPSGIVMAPRDGLILELNSAARRQIYSVLAESELNPAHFQPYAFRNGGFDDWFRDSRLSEPTLKLMRRLVYQRGSAICFSDLPQVMPQIQSVEERKRLVKTLWRNPAVMMKLRVRPTTEVNSLTAYWSRGWHVKDIGSLLESLTHVQGSITVDVAHLLPPFARRRLNSYPDPGTYTAAHAPDCFWTAFNFFSDTPDDRFHEKALWEQELKENYTLVAEPTFGDVILFVRSDSLAVHAASYVADDVAFTKNGDDFRQPWVLMKTTDLLARYSHSDQIPVRLLFYRSREKKG